MIEQDPDEYERSAAGLDFEEGATHERASAFGAKILENGPEALFDEIEELLPESWREHIRSFPVAAIMVGLGVGVWLGLKKSDEIIAAGTSFVSAAAMANVSQVIEKAKG